MPPHSFDQIADHLFGGPGHISLFLLKQDTLENLEIRLVYIAACQGLETGQVAPFARATRIIRFSPAGGAAAWKIRWHRGVFFLDKVPDLASQRFGNTGEQPDRGADRAAFDPADMTCRNPDVSRQSVLRKPSFEAHPLNIVPDSGFDFHGLAVPPGYPRWRF